VDERSGLRRENQGTGCGTLITFQVMDENEQPDAPAETFGEASNMHARRGF